MKENEYIQNWFIETISRNGSSDPKRIHIDRKAQMTMRTMTKISIMKIL